jgi:hypothetical protein
METPNLKELIGKEVLAIIPFLDKGLFQKIRTTKVVPSPNALPS